MMQKRYQRWFCISLIAVVSTTAFATRIKDITTIAGIRTNQLVGYGLVVGLDGTGDRVNQTTFTLQTFRNMLLQFGIRLPAAASLQLQNVAAVAISAQLQPFARVGQTMDITVSSLGNASSLRGGQLLMTPLKGADGQIYAIAQGSVIVSGFGAQGSDGSKVTVNSTSTGRIPNGATIEKTIEMPFVQNGTVTFELSLPDFTTAERIEQAINREFGQKIAKSIDARAIAVQLNQLANADSASVTTPTNKHLGRQKTVTRHQEVVYKGDRVESSAAQRNWQASPEAQAIRRQTMSAYVPFISRIENIELQPANTRAKVIINSRTGTIVVGQHVTLLPVAVSHGNLSVVITENTFISQPQAFGGGNTATGSQSDINITQSAKRAFVFAPGASLNDLVSAINSVGAAPGDLVAILDSIKSAGALEADLEII